MKKIIFAALCLSMSLLSTISYADDNGNIENAPVDWTSANAQDQIKIDNSSGANLSIQITVSGSDNAPGITIQNCGNTTAVQAGSSAICVTNDADNPVKFSSDNQAAAAKGTYQITQLAPQAPVQQQEPAPMITP